MRDVASGTDRHLDITFGLQVVKSSSLVSVLSREAFNHPYISYFHLLVNVFSVTCFCTFFVDPLLAHHQLSQQRPHFSPHSTAKLFVKAQISGKLVINDISDVASASVHSEKTRLKKMIMYSND